MCTAAVRPKRAIRALGSGSLFSIVPVAVESPRVPFAAFDSVSVRRLAAVVVRVVEDGHVDRCRGAAGADGERPARGGVVGAGRGRAVGGGVVDGDVAAGAVAERHREG